MAFETYGGSKGLFRVTSFARVCETQISSNMHVILYILNLFCQERVAFENKSSALSFFTDPKMDVMRTTITVLFIMFHTLIKEQQALNLQGND